MAWPKTIVSVEKEISARLKAERRAIPVMIPGRAIGRMTSKVMASFPRNIVRETAAAAKVPRISAMQVEIEATWSERDRASQTSGRFQVTSSHLSVNPGGGHW